MKTIATAAVLMMLAVPTWADEPANDPANSDEPIVLSEAEMDGVTAGSVREHKPITFTKEWGAAITSSNSETDMLIIGDFNTY